MRKAIGVGVRSPEILDELGAAGLKKVQETLTWSAKARQIFAVYEAVLNGEKDLRHLDYRAFQESSNQLTANLSED